jgi:inner membrane protein
MISPTHIAFAEFMYLLVLTTTGVPLDAGNASTVAIASVLADADTEASTVGKLLPFISRRIERRFRHRTVTHSLLMCAGIAGACFGVSWLWKNIYVSSIMICVVAGYLSHPLLDTMTVHGVRLFYPFAGIKCVFPLEVNNPHRYRIQTGSKQDKALCLFFLLACVPTYLVAHQGYERFIRATQKNVESAVRDYNEFSKTHLVRATLLAHNLFSKERVSGTFRVAGALNDHTLLFAGDDGRLHTLGKEYQSEFAAEEVICEKGEPARTSIRVVDMTDRPLFQITSFIDAASLCDLFGSIKTEDHVAIPGAGGRFVPVSGGGGELELKFATYADIQELGLDNVIVSAGQITVRTMTPAESPHASDSLAVQLPGQAGKHVRVSFETKVGERVDYLAVRGDTVLQGSVLARRTLSGDWHRRCDVISEQIAVLEEERDVRLMEHDNRLARTRQKCEADSVASLLQAKSLAEGFASKQSAEAAAAAYLGSQSDLEALRARRTVLVNDYSIKLLKLRSDLASLRTKAEAADVSAEIRSTVAGVIADFRQAPLKGKTQVTFVIRRP